MVGGRVNGRDAVHALGKTTGDSHGVDSVYGLIVEALEEGKLFWVYRRRLVERVELLDDDVRVALDVALPVQRLGRHVERRRRVREMARLEVADRDFDREVLVRLNLVAVGGHLELGRRHVRLPGDHAHRGLVARALGDLLAVRLLLVAELEAEVDEVVSGRQGGLLAVVGRARIGIRANESSESR